jgi:hypothetical protein
MKRRRVLLHVAGAASMTAGCLTDADSSAGTTTTTSTSATPSTTATPTTDEATATTEPRTTVEPEIETLPQESPENDIDCGDDELFEVSHGGQESYPERAEAFEVEASTDTVTIGEDVTFLLTHVGSEQRGIGTIYRYNIQRREDDEWVPVYHTPEPLWTDLLVYKAPGGGYEWSFTFDREGIERQNGPTNAPYHVCSPLEPGTYRFVYWGLGDGDGRAVEFTVENP